MKRIFIEKNDSAEEVVAKITEGQEEEMVLVIPKNSDLKKSPSDFGIIFREAEAAGKKIAVESVDEEVLAIARDYGREALHPFFNDSSRGNNMISDIVLTSARVSKASPKEPRSDGRTRKIRVKISGEAPSSEREDEVLREVAREARHDQEESVLDERKTSAEFRAVRRKGFPRLLKIILFACFGAILIIGGVAIFHKFFSRAEITINFKNYPWEYEGVFMAGKTIRQASLADNSLPAEVFRMQKNITQFFPASGKQEVSEKASAKLIIYNAYSSEPQTLVATTRFTAPNGKIFRLDRQIVVPGAQIRDGQIVPSSMETSVTADKAGPAYNIGPLERLSIPGLKGSPKYNGFYGAMPETAKGGFMGEKSVPTDSDIALAKQKTSEILIRVLKDSLLVSQLDGFTVLEGASKTRVGKLVVNKSTDADGNFSVLGEAELNTIAIQETAMKALLDVIKNKDYPDTEFKALNLEYQEVQPDFERGKLSFRLLANATLKPAFDVDSFGAKIAGKRVREFQDVILSLPDLQDAKVSLWPFWFKYIPRSISYIPAETKRIRVTVN